MGLTRQSHMHWTPANSAEVAGFRAAVVALPVAERTPLSITIRDFTPVAPSFSDDTGDAISGTVGTAIANVTVPEADGEPSADLRGERPSRPA